MRLAFVLFLWVWLSWKCYFSGNEDFHAVAIDETLTFGFCGLIQEFESVNFVSSFMDFSL